MSRYINHVFLSASYPLNGSTFSEKKIPVTINRVGEIDISVTVKAILKNLDYGSGAPHASLHPTRESDTGISSQLIGPLGKAFTKSAISQQDLNRYKNLRGIIKPWTLYIPVPKNNEFEGFVRFTGKQKVLVTIHETIPISSAHHVPPKTAEVLQDPVKKPIGIFPGAADAVVTQYKENEKITYGLRVPAFLISPYVEKGGVYHQNLDHSSILKTILIKFCGDFKPFLSDRVNVAHDLGNALKSGFRTIKTASPELPTLPEMKKKTAAKTSPIKKITRMTKAKLSGKGADFHEFLAFLGRTIKP